MGSRREFLSITIGAGAALACCQPLRAEAVTAKSATAITQVFGDGLKLTAVALEYDLPIDNASLSPSRFEVTGRTITKAYANTTANLAKRGSNGSYVILELSPEDAGAALTGMPGPGPGGPAGTGGAMSGPPPMVMSAPRKEAKAVVTQTGTIATTGVANIAASPNAIATSAVKNLIVDDFQPLEFHDPKSGELLRYNLFVPKGYDKNKAYPLVLFMHDAGATSTITDTTLRQGLGAVIWASPEEQAKHPAFVLAPQYATQTVNDKSEATSALDTTVHLVEQITRQYSIDRKRLYTTGQSGGAMMSIAIDIKYPDLFAASFIVAGQWDPSKVGPLAKDKLWIVVSEGDLKAFPGENAMTAVLEKDGAKISRAVWDGRSTPAEFATAVKAMDAEGAPIRYTVLKKGTVVPTGQHDDGGSNHINTWRIAYTIEGIRDWLFRQTK